MKKNKWILIIGLIALILLLNMQKKEYKKTALVTPPSGYSNCNVIYRSNFQSWNTNAATGGGSASAYWVYYNGETYSLGTNGDIVGGVCNIAVGDEIHIYGGIYYSSSSDKILWKGINLLNSAEQCTIFNNDAQADANVIMDMCHISFNTFWGGAYGKPYLDWVLCNNQGATGECTPTDLYNQFLLEKYDYINGGSSFNTFITNANKWINSS